MHENVIVPNQNDKPMPRFLTTIVGVVCVALPPSVVADGYNFRAAYTADLVANLSGGLLTGTRYLDNLDLTLEVDIAKAWGMASGTLFSLRVVQQRQHLLG